MGYRRRRYKRRRRGKRVTKRGVKALINIHAKKGLNRCKFRRSHGTYLGNVVGVVPTPVFGNVVRGSAEMEFHNYTDIQNDMATAALQLPVVPYGTVGAGKSAIQDRKMCIYRRRVNVMLHNPMNELVRATFWLVCPREGNSTQAVTEWSNQWTTKLVTSGTGTFVTDYTSYPSDYPQWRAMWKIHKKWSTVFQPGQTKRMWFKIPATQSFYPLDLVDGASKPFITYNLMYELKGVPTHQNNAGTQTENVNYSPAALDMCFEYTYCVSLSSGAMDLKLNGDFQRDAVTAGQSLINEGAGQIATV